MFDESILKLFIAALLFSGGHFTLSSIPVRKKIISLLDENKFLGLYSLFAITSLFFVINFWRKASVNFIWFYGLWPKYLAVGIMPIVCILFICSVSTKNPTSVGQSNLLNKEGELTYGITRVTRHPGLWSFTLWALVHLLANGDIASIIMFSNFGILAFFGMFHIDSRTKYFKPDRWEKFSKESSLFPFLAIIQGKNYFSLKEIGMIRILGGIAMFFTIFFTHKYVIGVPIL